MVCPIGGRTGTVRMRSASGPRTMAKVDTGRQQQDHTFQRILSLPLGWKLCKPAPPLSCRGGDCWFLLLGRVVVTFYPGPIEMGNDFISGTIAKLIGGFGAEGILWPRDIQKELRLQGLVTRSSSYESLFLDT